MEEVLRCFQTKMYRGADTLADLFRFPRSRGKKPVDPVSHRFWCAMWVTAVTVWECFKRFALIYVLVLLPVAIRREMPESGRILVVIGLLFFVQFLGGVAAPLGVLRKEPGATLRSQIFWERLLDGVYMPGILYIFTYSTGFTFWECILLTLCLILWRLIMEGAFRLVCRTFRLSEKSACFIFHFAGAAFCGAGLLLTLWGGAHHVGRFLYSGRIFLITLPAAAVSLFYLYRRP